MENTKFYNALSPQYIFGGNFYDEKILPVNIEFWGEKNTFPKSGGVSIRFLTDSKNIVIKFSGTDTTNGNFPHVGITARRGISVLYRNIGQTIWRYIDCVDFKNNSGELRIDFTTYRFNEFAQEIMICLPILTYITYMEIGIDAESIISPVPRGGMKKILVLGGLHSYGIGCTTTALMYSNILARKGNAIVYNISFNSNNFLEELCNNINVIVAELHDTDYVILEGDYVRQSEEIFLSKFMGVVEGLGNLKCPILMWGVKAEKLEKILAETMYNSYNIFSLSSIEEKLQKESDMCTYSRNFINDTANIIIYQELNKVLNLLEKESEDGVFRKYN